MSAADPSPQANAPNNNNGSSDPEDTGYTFTDDHWLRYRNTFRYLTGRLTAEGERQYKKGRDDRYAAADCRRCEEQRDYLLQYSTTAPFLRLQFSLYLYLRSVTRASC